ncbi:hypothetical protein C7B66_21470, partial [Bacillus halotolerans]
RHLLREDRADVRTQPEGLVVVVPEDAAFVVVVAGQEVAHGRRAAADVQVVALDVPVLVQILLLVWERVVGDQEIRLVVRVVREEAAPGLVARRRERGRARPARAEPLRRIAQVVHALRHRQVELRLTLATA